MADITITKVNCTWMKVVCAEVHMELDIQDRFSFEVANAQHDPRVRKGMWDGIKKLYNRRTKKMHCGLLFELMKLADKQEWSTYIDPELLPSEEQITIPELSELVSEVIKPHDDGLPIQPYDYQLDAVQYMLNMDRTVSLAATSAGKSLIIYMAVRLYQLMDELQGKTIFITVPSVALVEQLYADFQNYSTYDGSNWHVNQYCQKISGKYSKFVEKQIVITTWQSMEKLSYDAFEDIGAIFIDETHTAKASTLTKLIEQATGCPIRHGLTGTLDGTEVNELAIQGLLGPAKRIVTAKEIIDAGRATPVNVSMVMLNHSTENKKELNKIKSKVRGKDKYQKELEYLNALQSRREFLYGMIESLDGNTLVLFDRKEKYGKELYEEFKERCPEGTFLITGDVKVEDREDIRNSIEDYDDAVIWASYGTMSTGISIKKLHNMVLASSSKSVIRVLQSIGRMMRKHDEKSHATIYDVVDNFIIDGDTNYMMAHAAERIEFYKKEQYPIEFLDIKL